MADFTLWCLIFVQQKEESKPLGFIASLGSDNFVVRNLITFDHSHKAWVSMWIQIHTGDTALCVLWIYNLGALPRFQGTHEHCSFSGKPWTSLMVQKPARNVLKTHEMLKIWPQDSANVYYIVLTCQLFNCEEFFNYVNDSPQLYKHRRKMEIKDFKWMKSQNTKDVLLTVELSLLFTSCLASREFRHTVLSLLSLGTPTGNWAYRLFPYNL